MPEQIENLKNSRQFLLNAIKELNESQLNYIPDKFRNSIIWNMGHLIWAQQDLLVVLKQKPTVDKKYLELYSSGTFPEKNLEKDEIVEIKNILVEEVNVMDRSLNSNDPQVIKSLKGLVLHDWLHIGYILAMKRLL